MKKRLRKKRRVGEFTVWGRRFVIRRNRTDGFDSFLDWVVSEVVEGNDALCGGGGRGEVVDLVIELGRRDEGPDEKTRRIEAMLRQHPEVAEVTIGEEFDIWHGEAREASRRE